MICGSLADAAVKSALKQALSTPERYCIHIAPRDARQRTAEQNRYFRRLLRKLAQQQGGSVEEWHNALVARFLGWEDLETPDGEVCRVLCSTSELSVTEFSEFLTACLAFAQEHQIHIN